MCIPLLLGEQKEVCLLATLGGFATLCRLVLALKQVCVSAIFAYRIPALSGLAWCKAKVKTKQG